MTAAASRWQRLRWPAVVVAAAASAAAVAAVLLRPGEEAIGRADPMDARLVALGEGIYAAECASCHGADLEGQPDWRQRRADGRLPAPPHDASGHTWHHPDAFLFTVTKEGIEAVAPAGYKSDMPGFGERLSDEEIRASLAYIKSRWPQQVRARQVEIDRRARQAKD